MTPATGRDNHFRVENATDSIYSEISSAKQDAKWTAPKLMAMGAVALAIALAIIYTAASIIGE